MCIIRQIPPIKAKHIRSTAVFSFFQFSREGPVPFFIFTPFITVSQVIVKWFKSPPAKWDAPFGTSDISSSLYFSRRAVF